jgi:hypothetical protein
MMPTDEEIIAEHEKAIAEGTELEGYVRVNVRPSKNRVMSFAIRLSHEEMQEFSAAAKAKGMTLADFMRSASRAAAASELDVDRAAALGAAKEHARELADALQRL